MLIHNPAVFVSPVQVITAVWLYRLQFEHIGAGYRRNGSCNFFRISRCRIVDNQRFAFVGFRLCGWRFCRGLSWRIAGLLRRLLRTFRARVRYFRRWAERRRCCSRCSDDYRRRGCMSGSGSNIKLSVFSWSVSPSLVALLENFQDFFMGHFSVAPGARLQESAMAFRSMDSSTPSSPRVEGRPISLIKSAKASTPARANFSSVFILGEIPIRGRQISGIWRGRLDRCAGSKRDVEPPARRRDCSRCKRQADVPSGGTGSPSVYPA